MMQGQKQSQLEAETFPPFQARVPVPAPLVPEPGMGLYLSDLLRSSVQLFSQ
jgi:hypothetical protein